MKADKQTRKAEKDIEKAAKVKLILDPIREAEDWICEPIAVTVKQIAGKECVMLYYKQISRNDTVAPCVRWVLTVDGVPKGGGVIDTVDVERVPQ